MLTDVHSPMYFTPKRFLSKVEIPMVGLCYSYKTITKIIIMTVIVDQLN
jgi:hypothetical protein